MSNKKREPLEQYDSAGGDYYDYVKDFISPYIGVFFVEFSELERWINSFIAEMINERTHAVGYTLISSMTMSQKVKILHSLTKQYATASEDTELMKKVQKVFKSITNLTTFRNQLAHAYWFTFDKDGYVRVKTAENKVTGDVEFENVQMGGDTIPKKIEELNNAYTELVEGIYEKVMNVMVMEE